MNSRRDLLAGLASGAICAMLPGRAGSEEPAPQIYTYKKIDDLEIKADVYGPAPGAKRPTLMWVHGGALIQGARKGVPRQILNKLLPAGYVVISIDYRLAPETKLPGIIADLRDAYRWVRREGPQRYGVDPERMAVSGSSAGGYLTLMSGFTLEARPRALAAFYGYGDITTPWYSEPDAFYRKQPLVTKEEAERSVGKTPLAEVPAQHQRGRFYLYCRQQGLWPREVGGHDPKEEPRWFDPYCPIRNVTAQYPPSILIHGTADTDVPYSESRNIAARLKAAGVEHEFLTVPDAGHGLSGAPAEQVENAYSRAVEFLGSHTG
jgi:acetyl esterase/lipase